MDPKVIEKLKTLREYYYNDGYALRWIEETERNIRQLSAKEDIMKFEAIAAIVDDAKKRIQTINQLLTLDEAMVQADRDKLYRERAVHQFYVDRFEGRDIEKRFESINRLLDEEIGRITG